MIFFFQEVTKVAEREISMIVIYIDCQQAFDKIPHKRLLAEVEAHRIETNY